VFQLSFLTPHQRPMPRFNLTLFLLVLSLNAFALQSPHGKAFNRDCAECHQTDSWKDTHTQSFDHSKTHFPLVGQHKLTTCKSCHKSLVFSDAPTECSACHTDIHQQTTGKDCGRCHTPQSWLVSPSTLRNLHQQAGFPLVGAHNTADCRQCHTSGTGQRYDILNTACYSCHRDKYEATTQPNHRAAGFGTDCDRCHNMVGQTWNGIKSGFEHGFFPLKGGHNLACTQCHVSGTYKGLSSACASCHLDEYNATTNPAHKSSGFSTACQTCHTINAWKPSTFNHDNAYFPINSGTHKGRWDACSTCHTQPSNYSQFTCLNCHEHNKASMDSRHRGRSGYSYTSTACLSCHPRGKAD